jgi:hypothetical protein
MAQGNHVLVEGGVVVWGPGELPRSWKNHSGLNMKSVADLKTLGWLPWSEVLIPYDNKTHYRDDYTHDIQADQVIYTDIIRAFTAEQLTQNNWNDWSTEMSESDRLLNPTSEGVQLPRQIEDVVNMLINKFPNILDEAGNEKMKERYDAKRALRGIKPPQP